MRCDIVVDSREFANMILHDLKWTIDSFGFVTVAEVNDLMGYPIGDKDRVRGWTDLNKAKVIQVRDGWSIVFPNPKELIAKDEDTKPKTGYVREATSTHVTREGLREPIIIDEDEYDVHAMQVLRHVFNLPDDVSNFAITDVKLEYITNK